LANKLLDFTFKYGALLIIAGVVVFFTLVNEYFLTYANITDILRAISIVTFIAIGVTFSQVVDGFDISVGSTVSLTTIITATLMVWYQQPLWIVLVVPILIGAAIGLLNSLLIVKLKIPDCIKPIPKAIRFTTTCRWQMAPKRLVNSPSNFSGLGKASCLAFHSRLFSCLLP